MKIDKYCKNKAVESDSDSDSDYETGDDETMDSNEYRKFLNKLFPSKYLKNKIEQNKKSPRSKPATPYSKKKIKDKKETIVNKNKKKIDSDDDDDEEEEEEDEEDEVTNQKFNIVFTIGDPNYDEDEDEDEDEDDDSDSDEEEEEEEEGEEEEEEEAPKKKNYSKKDEMIIEKFINMASSMAENPEHQDSIVLKELKQIGEEKKKEIDKNKNKVQKKEKMKNLGKFKKSLKEKNNMNDFKFFQKLDVSEQQTILSQVEEIQSEMRVDKPYRIKLLECDIPTSYKASAFKKINMLRNMDPGGGEYYKMKNWVDTFMRIPFGKIKSLPLTIDDGIEKCNTYMTNAKKTLDETVYGLDDAKMQIMQLIGQWITNPSAVGTAIAIKGPPGTGKTTLVKEGISKILNRDFAFIALGGATDSSFLEGHGYTYEGSTWGKVVEILTQCTSMNPIIYFDELDKISDTPKGDEINGILTHLTDTSQNSEFHDKYFSEIHFDLSKCLFIFSYNDESRVNPILKDRMYRIQTEGYNDKEKTEIAKNYLLPKIREQVKFKEEEILINDAVLGKIITDYTMQEKGVRNLKRCLEIIYTKLNLYRLMSKDSIIFDEKNKMDVTFPYTVVESDLKKLLKKEDSLTSEVHRALYI